MSPPKYKSCKILRELCELKVADDALFIINVLNTASLKSEKV